MLMVQAGPGTDAVIDQLAPLLAEGPMASPIDGLDPETSTDGAMSSESDVDFEQRATAADSSLAYGDAGGAIAGVAEDRFDEVEIGNEITGNKETNLHVSLRVDTWHFRTD